MADQDGGVFASLPTRDAHSGLTPLELYTAHNKVIGHLSGGTVRISDIFNQTERSYVTIQMASITPLSGGKEPARVDEIQIIRSSVVLVIPRDTALPQGTGQRTMVFVAKERHRIVIEAPPFSISGTIHLVRESRIRDALVAIPSQFIPLTEATITILGQALPVKAETAIVNRSFIEIMYPQSALTSQPQPEQPPKTTQSSKLLFRRP